MRITELMETLKWMEQEYGDCEVLIAQAIGWGGTLVTEIAYEVGIGRDGNERGSFYPDCRTKITQEYAAQCDRTDDGADTIYPVIYLSQNGYSAEVPRAPREW